MSKRSNRAWYKNLSRGVDDLPVTPNPRWGGFQELTAPVSRTSWSWAGLNQGTAPHLDSTRVALHHSGEVSTRPLTTDFGALQQSPWRCSTKSTSPSRERQLPRVTSRRRLLEVCLVSQSSNSWCNAQGCSHTLKDAISKQGSVREGKLSSNVSSMQSKWPKEPPQGRPMGIYRDPLKS